MNKNRLYPVSLRTLLAPLCISLFVIWGGGKLPDVWAEQYAARISMSRNSAL